MKQLKKSLQILISFFGIGTAVVLACAGGDWDEFEGSMFSPEIINQPAYEPFFRTSYYPFYTGYYEEQLTACKDLNVKEWNTYFDSKSNEDQLKYWLYKAEPTEVNNMIFFLKGTTKDVPKLNEESKKYSLALLNQKDKSIAFLYYVGFAKRNEKFGAKAYSSWSGEEVLENGADINKQIEGGKKFFSNAKNNLLKERYLYQLIRLHYFNLQYKEAIDLYNANVNVFSETSSMKWRSLEYVAGCYYKQKDYSNANYLFSVVYDKLPEHKKSAFLSFHPQEDKDWNQSLSLAKTTREKSVLWQLFGIYADPERAIGEIYKLDPKSELMELLLVRLINKEEEGAGYTLMRTVNGGNNNITDPKQFSYKVINEVAAKGNTAKPLLWKLGAAYLSYKVNDFKTGDKFLKEAEGIKNQSELSELQYNIVSLSGKLMRADKMDASLEKNILPELKVIFESALTKTKGARVNFAQRWVRNVLAVLYAQKGEYEKAEMIQPGTLKNHFVTIANLEKMVAYYENTNHSELENFFLSKDFKSKYDYLDLIGIKFAQQDMLDSSLVYFKRVNDNSTLYGNPFTIHIKDCHDCDHQAIQKTKYTKASFIEKMIEMKNKAKSNKAEAAQNYFLIANGYYNITYYGNARIFYATDIYSWDYYNDDKTEKILPENDCKTALKYYLLAKESSTDKEFKAKCTFMAAKCEQNFWYQNIPKGYKGDFKSGDYFKQLKKEYSSTKYYQEILKECSYFSLYATN